MIQGKAVAAVVVAAGKSSRMGFDKLFYAIDGVEVLRHSVHKMDAHPDIDRIVVVAGENIMRVRALFQAHPIKKPLVIVEGGECRAASVSSGIAACPDAAMVAIHDGARPFVSAELISRILLAAAENGAAAPALPINDTVKRVKDGYVVETVDRQALRKVQTPQAFDRAAYARAMAGIGEAELPSITDDCMVMERAGQPVRLVMGEPGNRKITTPEDLRAAKQPEASLRVRAGHGYDVHRLVEGRPLIIGGVRIEHEKGLLGHSDADVLLHAVADALLGAAAMGDIGQHFPDREEAYKNADSKVLLTKVAGMLRDAGYVPQNIDATLVCQSPRLAPHIVTMRRNIAAAVGLSEIDVSVKATTEEGLGFTGQKEGISAHCVALVTAEG